jgi:hypothetical protein
MGGIWRQAGEKSTGGPPQPFFPAPVLFFLHLAAVFGDDLRLDLARHVLVALELLLVPATAGGDGPKAAWM